MNKIYTCECGKQFTKPNSFNAHKSNCFIHFEYLGKDLNIIREKRRQSLLKTINKQKLERKIKQEEDFKNLKLHCEFCGKLMSIKYGSGRFCCQSCANHRKHSEETKRKISKANSKGRTLYEHKCFQCNKVFKSVHKNQKYCSNKCVNDYRKQCPSKISSEEWSIINRRAYETGKNYVSGGKTKWYNYNENIKVQGTFELRTCFILDKLKETNKILDWEYTKDKIKYTWTDGKLHNYFLDFKVFNLDNSFYYIEVKGFKTLKDELKWKAAKEQNINLIVWYIKDIIKYEKELGIKYIDK